MRVEKFAFIDVFDLLDFVFICFPEVWERKRIFG